MEDNNKPIFGADDNKNLKKPTPPQTDPLQPTQEDLEWLHRKPEIPTTPPKPPTPKAPPVFKQVELPPVNNPVPTTPRTIPTPTPTQYPTPTPAPIPTNMSDETHPRAARVDKYQRWVHRLWQFAIVTFTGIIGMFCVLSFFIPSFEELENPNSYTATQVLGTNSEVLGRYFVENRVPVNYKELSPHLIRSLVATEDSRFYEHSGIDGEAIGRVVVKTVLMGKKNQGGGSTITQQLAKLLYSDRDFKGMNPIRKTFMLVMTKFREWITAVKLERRYTKEELIAMYLNKFNFINGAYGIRAASEIYFGKSQKDLGPDEAALLIGMLQNPSLNNPLKRPENAKRRRNEVLANVLEKTWLTKEDYKKYAAKPVDMTRFNVQTHSDGLAPYFRMEIRKDIAKIMDDEKLNIRKPDGTKYNIYLDGLKVYTTIDPKIQQHAETAMREHMSQLQKKFWKVWKGKNPWTYKVKSDSTDADITAEQIELRQRMLRRTVQESGRYLVLRDRYVDPIINAIAKDIPDFEIKDADIENMMRDETEIGTIGRLVAMHHITESKAAKYRSIMRNANWGKLRERWKILQEAARVSFSTARKMRIFAYNSRNETDTTMTPLDSIRYLKMHLQAGVLALDPKSGEVKAWVGGVNYKYFQFDHIRTNRQVGSTFKPFVYATAISERNFTPCSTVQDVQYSIRANEGNFKLKEDWVPKNARNDYSRAFLTLKEGLKQSKNTISVYIMKQIGSPDPVRGLVNNMGIDSSARRGGSSKEYRVPKQPSICLGATDLSVMEMTGAYSTFANNGKWIKPTFIKRIEDKNGKILYQAGHEERLALSEQYNYTMVQMLRYVTHGAPGLNVKSDIGGKTGTTNDFVDGWFMGITPTLVVGTWVGGEDRWIRFLNIEDGQGAVMARPIFAKLISKLEKDNSVGFDTKAKFSIPKTGTPIPFECVAAVRDSTGAESEDFFKDTFEDGVSPNATAPVAPTVKKQTTTTPINDDPKLFEAVPKTKGTKPEKERFGDEDDN
jgi:penicillin-binding protein 1A